MGGVESCSRNSIIVKKASICKNNDKKPPLNSWNFRYELHASHELEQSKRFSPGRDLFYYSP